MKKFIKEITKSMQGSLLPKRVSEEQIVKEINDSLKKLDYYGTDHDKKNMKEDVSSFNRDFNKATREAKIKFEPAL
jgi:hypothetical protein|nr:MAG TPA_asm: hypothetical protein [Bacteriophage sp.]